MKTIFKTSTLGSFIQTDSRKKQFGKVEDMRHIINIMVALLLPAIGAAREAARTQAAGEVVDQSELN